MTLLADRLEALVVARARSAERAQPLGELIKPLARFAPAELTEAAWRDRVAAAVGELRARDVLDAEHRVHDAAAPPRIGKPSARWPELADRVLPGLALGIADDGKPAARLTGRDAWAAAIAGRALGLWTDGPPPSLAALCDALAWRELELTGKPKRCPPEIRALFVQRQLRTSGGSASGATRDDGPPERLVRLLAAREVGAPRPELRALRDALVRGWLAGRALGGFRGEPGHPPAADVAGAAGAARSFAADVASAAGGATDGRFGDRKVFVSAVWHELRRNPRWAALALDELKARLVAAHRAGELVLARADLVAAMDPALVAASEITAGGASFHFVVVEPTA